MELWFRIRDFFRYTLREKKDIIVAVLVVGFAIGYNDGRDEFVASLWLMNLLKVLLLVYLSMMLRVAFQKIVALSQGFTVEFRAWPTGLALCAIVALLSNGHLYFLLFGGLVFYHMTLLRIGKFRYGENAATRGMIAASGAFANLILATIGLMFSAQLSIFPDFFDEFALINFWIMIFSLLPLPRLDGIHVFFMSRLVYVFIFSTLLAYVLLTLVDVYSWLLAFIIGVICWLLFYIYFESK